MTETARRIKPLNLTPAQASRLVTAGELLVVVPCDPQPVVAGYDAYVLMEPNPEVGDNFYKMEKHRPYQPGDVVPCRESWACNRSVCGSETVYRVDLDPSEQKKFIASNGFWRPPTAMSHERIRLRPVVASVECRRVNLIADHEVIETGLKISDPDGRAGWSPGFYIPQQFAADWNRRHKRHPFETAWAWFVSLARAKEQT